MINLIQQLRIEAHNNVKWNVKSGDILSVTLGQYKNKKKKQNIKGVCLGIKNDFGYSRVMIRNIVAGEGVEQSFLLQSPLLLDMAITGKTKKGSRSKRYYLRNKSLNETRIV